MADDIRSAAQAARAAAQVLATTTEDTRNEALTQLILLLEQEEDLILAANRTDVERAEAQLAEGKLTAPLVERLKLTEQKFASLLEMIRSVKAQDDPLERTLTATEIAEKLAMYKVSVPIGVIGVIFESRPDALVQIAVLCLKSGNAVLLKGGSEAIETNRALAGVIQRATEAVGDLPDNWMALLETRDDVKAMLAMDDHIDLIIPRGSKEFVKHIMANTKIPVMGHADGVCHVYVDRDADIDKATRISVDAKTQYVSVCNAAETLLVHRDIAAAFFQIAAPVFTEKGVLFRGDEETCRLVPEAVPATEDDWSAEYLDYVIAVKVVDSLDEAIGHINQYGSHHTDAIVTEDRAAAKTFLRSVDSASVIHNASTRFADGFRFGLGAEVGIGTDRLHGRGPVGLEGLTIYKYIVEGDGHTVDDFEGDYPTLAYNHHIQDETWPLEEY